MHQALSASSKLCNSTGSCTWQGDVTTAAKNAKYAWDTVTWNTEYWQAKRWNIHSISDVAPTRTSAALSCQRSDTLPCGTLPCLAHFTYLGRPIKEGMAVAAVTALLLWWLDGQDQRHGGAGTGSSHAACDITQRKDSSTPYNEPLKILRCCKESRKQPAPHLKILVLFSHHRIPVMSVGAHWKIVGSL